MTLRKDKAPIAESDEEKLGVILDYDDGGNLIFLEMLEAWKRVTETRQYLDGDTARQLGPGAGCKSSLTRDMSRH